MRHSWYSAAAPPARWRPTSCATGSAGDEWQITVVDQDDEHLYQPGLLLLPFGVYTPDELVKPRTRRSCRDGVDLVLGEIDRVDADERTRRAGRRPARWATTTWSSRPAPRRGRTRRPAWPSEAEWRRQHLRLLHAATAPPRCATSSRLAGRPAGRARRRDADQVPGRAAGVHLPRRRLLRRARDARQGRDHLRDAAGGRVHQAGRVQAPRRHARPSARSRIEADFVVDTDRRRSARRWSRWTSARCRSTCWSPSRSTWAPTSSRARASATSSTTCRSTSTRCCPRSTTTSSPSATPRTSRPPRPARSRTSRSSSSSTTSSSTSTAGR